MYAPDIVSVEGDGKETAGKTSGHQEVRGLGLRQNLQRRNGRAARSSTAPNQFAVYFTLDVTPKATGKRITLRRGRRLHGQRTTRSRASSSSTMASINRLESIDYRNTRQPPERNNHVHFNPNPRQARRRSECEKLLGQLRGTTRHGSPRRRNSRWCSKPSISDRSGPRTSKSPSNTADCVTPISPP